MGSGLKGEKCLINHLLRVVRQLRPADILCRREAAEQGNGMSVMHPALSALAGTGFTCLMTALGAAMVFFFRGEVKAAFQQAFLGFAAGVMIAASIWSLLMPAIEMAEERGTPGWLPAAGGFLIGAVFLQSLDRLLPHLHPGSDQPEGLPARLRCTTMLVFAVTLHNLPEGMAVGLSFALAAQDGEASTLAGALALAIGIGLQNFPEGAAISLAGSIAPLMPWLLAFAAGAMIYVVVEELIPEAQLGEHSHVGTAGVLIGFVVMMVLDVALG